MQVLSTRIVASALGAAVVLGCGAGIALTTVAPRAEAQVAAAAKAANQGQAVPKGAAGAGAAGAPNLPAWTAAHASPQGAVSPQGIWAEVIASTSRWIVVQNQDGQQLPIAADRIRQFLVRWPSTVNDLTENSMVEATGPQVASNTMATDHIDVYEADAQNLVSPTLQSVAGPGGGGPPAYGNTSNFSFLNYESLNFGSLNWTEMPSNGAVSWTDTPNVTGGGSLLLHVVGRPTSNNPVILGGFGPGAITVSPGPNGMSVSQITLGTNSYAKKGDLVHLIAESASPRGLDVSQLVLYKKIPLRRFQP